MNYKYIRLKPRDDWLLAIICITFERHKQDSTPFKQMKNTNIYLKGVKS